MESRSPRIEFVAGPEVGRVVELAPGRSVTIGRVGASEVVVDDPTVSSEHCRLTEQGGTVLLVDLGSMNGCLVNDVPVARRELEDGDRITLGSVAFEFTSSLSAARRPTTLLQVDIPSRRADGRAFDRTERPARLPDVDALNLLFRAGHLANSGQPMVEVLGLLLDELRLALGADRVLFVREEVGGETDAAFATAPDLGDQPPRLATSVGEAIRRGQTVVLEFDPREGSPWQASETLVQQGVRALVCVPVLIGERLVGALYADILRGEGGFDRRTAEVLSAIADILAAGVARENNEREARELERMLRQSENLAVIGLMASGIVHDLKNVLQCLTGYAQLAEADEEVHRDLPANVIKFCKKAETTIRSILATAGRTDQGRRRFDLGGLVGDVEVLMAAKLRHAGMELTVTRPDEPAEVEGDPGELQDAILNLCLNAMQVMTDGGGTLAITLAVENGLLRLDVADTGPGIPDEIRQRLFQPFASTRREGQGGTGLGLYRVQRIVEGHGGRIEVESEVGRGTTFSIRLPVAP